MDMDDNMLLDNERHLDEQSEEQQDLAPMKYFGSICSKTDAKTLILAT
jgi:hypothetical protein